MSEVQLVRLASGEEILAKIENLGEAHKFAKPHIIIPTQAKGIALMPWCPYSNIQEEGVVVPTIRFFHYHSTHELAKEYTTHHWNRNSPAGDIAAKSATFDGGLIWQAALRNRIEKRYHFNW